MGIGLALALSAAMMLSLQARQGATGEEDAIYAACTRAGGETAECACVSREARSRFTPVQLEIIAQAIPDLENVGKPQAMVDQLGLNFDQILNLRQRAMAADEVIRAACGKGLGH